MASAILALRAAAITTSGSTPVPCAARSAARALRVPPSEDDVAAPEIDRGQLRAMLAEHVNPGTVRWGHKLVATTPLGDGTHRLEFANDGAGRAVIGQRNSNGRIRGYVGIRTDVDWYDKAGVDLADTAAVREFLLKEFDGWSAELLTFISENDGDFANRPIFALPAPLAWAHTPGVTLLGDAAHLMTPWGGFGVNLAMLDGADPGTGPDHKAEHRRWVDAAAEYRRRQAPSVEKGRTDRRRLDGEVPDTPW